LLVTWFRFCNLLHNELALLSMIVFRKQSSHWLLHPATP